MTEIDTAQQTAVAAPQPRSRRLTFSLAALFGLMTLAAVIAKWPLLMMLAAPVLPALLTLVYAAPTRRETWLRYGCVIAAVYAPTARGFFLDCSHCREIWSQCFLAIPGFIPSHLGMRLFGIGRLPDQWEFAISALVVTAFIALLYLIAARGWIRLTVAVIIGFVLSMLSCLIFAALLRS